LEKAPGTERGLLWAWENNSGDGTTPPGAKGWHILTRNPGGRTSKNAHAKEKKNRSLGEKLSAREWRFGISRTDGCTPQKGGEGGGERLGKRRAGVQGPGPRKEKKKKIVLPQQSAVRGELGRGDEPGRLGKTASWKRKARIREKKGSVKLF